MVHSLASASEALARGFNLLINPSIIEPFAVLAAGGLGDIEKGWDMVREFWGPNGPGEPEPLRAGRVPALGPMSPAQGSDLSGTLAPVALEDASMATDGKMAHAH